MLYQHLFSARRAWIIFFNKFLKWTFRSDFVKLGSEILYLFLAENGRLLFVCFVATLFHFGLLFFKDAFKEKII